MKVIIAGTRTFNDYETLCSVCDHMLLNQQVVEVVSGTARGADTLGERYAAEKGYPIKRFHANWDRYGKQAGYIRNRQMAEYADALIVFWDGKSRGTKNMIGIARESRLKVKVHGY